MQDNVVEKRIYVGELSNYKEGYEHCYMDHLEDLYDGSIGEIWCDALEYSVEEILGDLLKKIKHGGKISLEGADLYEIIRDGFNRYLSYNDIIIKLYGGKNRIYSVGQIVEKLEKVNFKIIKKRVNNYIWFVEAIRQ